LNNELRENVQDADLLKHIATQASDFKGVNEYLLMACILILCLFGWAYPMEFDYKVMDAVIRAKELPLRANKCTEKYNEYSYIPVIITLIVSHIVIVTIGMLAGMGTFKGAGAIGRSLKLLQTNFTQMK